MDLAVEVMLFSELMESLRCRCGLTNARHLSGETLLFVPQALDLPSTFGTDLL